MPWHCPTQSRQAAIRASTCGSGPRHDLQLPFALFDNSLSSLFFTKSTRTFQYFLTFLTLRWFSFTVVFAVNPRFAEISHLKVLEYLFGRGFISLGEQGGFGPLILTMVFKVSKIRNRSSRSIKEFISSRTYSSSVEPSKPYIYTALSEPESQIRLLTIFPSQDPSAEIRCHLEVVPLATCAPYEALSYAWGDAHYIHPIVLNACRALVTENLYSALRHLRHLDRSRTVWIDDLCIDQRDNSEKSHQVKQMSQIYSGASDVVVWLGAASDDSDLAFDASPGLRQLVGILRGVDHLDLHFENIDTELKLESFLQSEMTSTNLAAPSSDIHEALAAEPRSFEGSPIKRLVSDIFGTDGSRRSSHDIVNDLEAFIGHGAWAALQNLFQRSWWGRLWVIQECALGRNVSFMCGCRVLGSAQIDELANDFLVLSVIRLPGLINTPNRFRIQCASEILRLRRKEVVENNNRKPIYLLPILSKVAKAACSDPRDKIFAVSGLSNEKFAAFIEPDYSIPVVDVYLNFTRTWLNNKRNLDILNCCHPLQFSGGTPGLPTWVPDWADDVYIPLITYGLEVGCQMFSASRGVPFDSTQSRSNPSSLVLRAEGFSFDIVAKVHPPLCFSKDSPPASVLKLWQSQEITSNPLEFWHTLARGRDQHGRRLKGADLERFEDHVRCLHSMDLGIKEWARSPDFKWVHELVETTDSFFTTTSGHMGMGVKNTQVGDRICVLFGGQTPFILRRLGSSSESGENRYMFVSESYVHGVMDGEAMEQLEQGKYTKEVFEIE